jgi:hypothetical protein
LCGVLRGWDFGAQQTVDGGEGGDLPGLHRGFLGEAERTAGGVEGVADVPELGVELV